MGGNGSGIGIGIGIGSNSKKEDNYHYNATILTYRTIDDDYDCDCKSKQVESKLYWLAKVKQLINDSKQNTRWDTTRFNTMKTKLLFATHVSCYFLFCAKLALLKLALRNWNSQMPIIESKIIEQAKQFCQ